MTAEIHYIPGVAWSPEAAIEDARQRIGDAPKMLIAWYDKDGTFHFAQGGMKNKDICWLGSTLLMISMSNNDGVLHNGDDTSMNGKSG